MRKLVLISLLLLGCQRQEVQPQIVQPVQPVPTPTVPEFKVEGTYQGIWVTTNVHYEGIMRCDVIKESAGNWKGIFYGVWQGRKFSYEVHWTGEPHDWKGNAIIDTARYKWTGKVNQREFKGEFTGSRYTGYFNLKKVI